MCGAVFDIAQGTNCSLRADVTGAPIVDRGSDASRDFFNTLAFAVPAAGTFGNSVRNAITGPGSHQLNASLIRDIRLGGNRALTLRVNANNLLNTVRVGDDRHESELADIRPGARRCGRCGR